MSEMDEIRQSLRRLGRRLAEGEIDEAAYDRLREKLLADLSPAERVELAGSATPSPLTPSPAPPPFGSTPPPVPPSAFGPSGARGKGLATRIASLSDLDLKPGAVLFGQWRIERELGRGGFGVVVEAEELTLRERQAVKVLDPAMVARPELLERFRREVRATRKLVHPRIVRVFDYRENLPEGLALFSMEYVRGCSVQLLLARAREQGRAVPVRLALSILAQVLEALEAAHAQGVIHRDVTPGNILLAGGTPKELVCEPGRDPCARLVDFGIAGALERSELSQKSRVLGTAAYVAPEVLDPRVDVTPAADVYGAGAVFYELLTGEAPLGRFEDPSRIRPEVGPDVNALVLSLLQRQPSMRPEPGAAREAARNAVADVSRGREQESQRRAREAEAVATRYSEERAVRSPRPQPPPPLPQPSPPQPPLSFHQAPEAWSRPPVPAVPHAAAYGMAAGEAPGFALRLQAWMIDVILMLLLWCVAFVPAAIVSGKLSADSGDPGPAGILMLILFWSLQLAVPILYPIGFWAIRGQTPGKKMFRMRVVREDGEEPLGWATASRRLVGYLVSTLLLGIGFLMIGIHPQKKGLHDLIARTRVVTVR